MGPQAIDKTIQDITDGFALFDSWEDRYRYIIELGQRLEPMDESLKTPETKVEGCTSQVWMVCTKNGDKYRFIVDSDALIVRGLIYVLLTAYQDKTAEEIAKVDIKTAFEKLGLNQHLSPNRRNGFFAMVNRVHEIAGVQG